MVHVRRCTCVQLIPKRVSSLSLPLPLHQLPLPPISLSLFTRNGLRNNKRMAKYLHIDSDKEGPAVFANLDRSGGQHVSQEEFITYFLSEDRLREQHDKYWREQELLLQREKEQREARERKESEEEVVRQKKLKEEVARHRTDQRQMKLERQVGLDLET